MYHMQISGTEPSSVILSQTKDCRSLKRNVLTMPKQVEAKRDGVINPQNYNSNRFDRRKISCYKKATNQPKSTIELSYMCPRGLMVHQQ